MATSNEFPKHPTAEIEFGIRWTKWLETDEVIATSLWTLPTGITESEKGDSHDGAETQIWLAGGTAGDRYRCQNSIVTSVGRRDTRSIIVEVVER